MQFERDPEGDIEIRCTDYEFRILVKAARERIRARHRADLYPHEIDEKLNRQKPNGFPCLVRLDRPDLDLIAFALDDFSQSDQYSIKMRSRQDAAQMASEIREEIQILDFVDQINDTLPPNE